MMSQSLLMTRCVLVDAPDVSLVEAGAILDYASAVFLYLNVWLNVCVFYTRTSVRRS